MMAAADDRLEWLTEYLPQGNAKKMIKIKDLKGTLIKESEQLSNTENRNFKFIQG